MLTIRKDFARSLLAAYTVSTSADEFCKQLVHRVLPGVNAVGAIITKVGDDSKCHIAGKHGAWLNLPTSGVFEHWRDSPIGAAVRQGKSVLFKDGSKDHLEFIDYTLTVTGAGFYAYLPFTRNPRALGVIGLAFQQSGLPPQAKDADLELIADAAEYFTHSARQLNWPPRKGPYISEPSTQATVLLTNRDLAILKMMSADQTNFQIGKSLNLSESTIKQESVKIYRKLGVDNRNDAWARAQESGLL